MAKSKKKFNNVTFGRNLNIQDIPATEETKNALKEVTENPTPETLIETIQIIHEDAVLPTDDKTELIKNIRDSYISLFNFENCPEDYFDLKKEAKFLAGMTQYSFLLMAQRIKKIRDGELYRQDGYTDFKSFVEKELSISRQTAYKYMDIITYFPVAPERHDTLDYTKLLPIIPLLKSANQDIPKEEIKQKFIHEINLKSKREMEDEAKELKMKYGLLEHKQNKQQLIKILIDLYAQLKKSAPASLDEEQREVIIQIIEYLKDFVQTH